MTFYQIRNWNEHYENNRTRELKKMTWVPMPNQLDGDGYTELLNHPNGAAHFGAWCALVEVASRCGGMRNSILKDIEHPFGRGRLIRNTGEAHDSTSLARITRISKNIFEEVFPRLISIGWIEIYKTNSQSRRRVRESADANGTKPQEGAVECLWNGMEWNGKNGTEDTLSGDESPDDEVERFLSKQKHEEKRAPTKEIVGYLNAVCKTDYRPEADYIKKLIKARWNDGYRLDDFKSVIDIKAKRWLTDQKMVAYLRPSTLFRPANFESYLNEARKAASSDKRICPKCGISNGMHAESCELLHCKQDRDEEEI